MNTTLVILIDAFSRNYYSSNHTPFLRELAQDGVVSNLEPMFAFRGIETTIFTGAWPTVHGVWTDYSFVRNRIPSLRDICVRELVRCILRLQNDNIVVPLRYIVEKYFGAKNNETPNLIPVQVKKFFEPSQAKPINRFQAVPGIPTLFDIFRDRHIKFAFVKPSALTGDEGVYNKIIRMIKQDKKCQFWFIKFNRLDQLGHKYGPSISSLKEDISKIDNYIENIVLLLQKKVEPNLLILADHGISKVKRTVNLLKELAKQGPKLLSDYVFFIDSTMIRFWFLKKNARKEIEEYLATVNCGHILTRSERKVLRVPQNPKHGELIYVFDEGYVAHPDFFHKSGVVKGMHGYAFPKTNDANPLLIINKKMLNFCQIDGSANYAQLFAWILRSLSVQ